MKLSLPLQQCHFLSTLDSGGIYVNSYYGVLVYLMELWYGMGNAKNPIPVPNEFYMF